jgi:class 3 adenylate cyclase
LVLVSKALTPTAHEEQPVTDRDRIDRVPSLDELDIFKDVDPRLYRGARRRDYIDGDGILVSGADPDDLGILVRGDVAIFENGVRIARRSAVSLIGELAIIDGRPRSATVVAEGPVVMWLLPHEDVPALMADPVFLRSLSGALTAKLREATEVRAQRFLTEERLFGAFRSHVSAEGLQDLLEHGIDGTPRQADVVTLFADVRDFTQTSGEMTADELARELGAWLDVAVDVIHAHGGMVDKFIGDEVMALWGYNSGPDADAVLACSRELVGRAAQLTLNGQPIRIGVGIEAGLVTLGVIGGEGKRQFTALGQPVNTAARLQGMTKELGATVCVGPDFYGRLADADQTLLTGPHNCEVRGVGRIEVWTLAREGD